MKFRSKKGQLPFIELNGEEIADSAIIIKELSAKFEKDLDAGLTQEQRNIAHATISMIENHLVWIVYYWRTKNPDLLIKGYKVNLQHALGCRLPNGILNFFFRFTFGRKVCITAQNRANSMCNAILDFWVLTSVLFYSSNEIYFILHENLRLSATPSHPAWFSLFADGEWCKTGDDNTM